MIQQCSAGLAWTEAWPSIAALRKKEIHIRAARQQQSYTQASVLLWGHKRGGREGERAREQGLQSGQTQEGEVPQELEEAISFFKP